MKTFGLRIMLGGFALGLSACSAGDPVASDSGTQSLEPAGITANADASGGAKADASSVEPAGSVDAEAAIPGPASANELTAYVGKFPFDAVNGVTWLDHPVVTAGIRKTVTDAAVRRAMQSPGGPSAPIGTYQGKVGSWGCQQHNCGDHHWAVLVDPRTGATDVCYHNVEEAGEASRWFLADGRQETRPGNCSVV